MLFIHGDKDTFVPYDMLDRNYDACASKVKQKRTIHDAAHAKSAQVDPELYWNTVNKLPRRVFLGNKQRLGFVAKNALWSAVFDFSPHFRKAARERCARERLLLELRHKGAYIVQ